MRGLHLAVASPAPSTRPFCPRLEAEWPAVVPWGPLRERKRRMKRRARFPLSPSTASLRDWSPGVRVLLALFIRDLTDSGDPRPHPPGRIRSTCTLCGLRVCGRGHARFASQEPPKLSGLMFCAFVIRAQKAAILLFLLRLTRPGPFPLTREQNSNRFFCSFLLCCSKCGH